MRFKNEDIHKLKLEISAKTQQGLNQQSFNVDNKKKNLFLKKKLNKKPQETSEGMT